MSAISTWVSATGRQGSRSGCCILNLAVSPFVCITTLCGIVIYIYIYIFVLDVLPLRKLGNYELADECFLQSLVLCPDYPDALKAQKEREVEKQEMKRICEMEKLHIQQDHLTAAL